MRGCCGTLALAQRLCLPGVWHQTCCPVSARPVENLPVQWVSKANVSDLGNDLPWGQPAADEVVFGDLFRGPGQIRPLDPGVKADAGAELQSGLAAQAQAHAGDVRA